MSIVLQGSTSGSITLQEPAVAGSTVLSLPATSGTLITTGSSGQSIPKAALPTGSVLQVINATNSTRYSGISGSENTLFSFSITPLFASSRIAILGQFNIGVTGTYVNYAVLFRLRRGTNTSGTELNSFRYGQYQGGGGVNRELYGSCPIFWLDSPNTTSSQSYCFTVANIDGASAYDVNINGASSIILMEIAA